MGTAQHSVVRDLPLEFEDAHTPSSEDQVGFIENWLLAWYDPERRAGGYHHVGLRRTEGLADVWNWVALEGEVIGKTHTLTAQIPERPMSDMTVAGMHFGTAEPFQRYFLKTEFEHSPNGPVTLQLDFAAFADPIAFSQNSGTVTLGAGHYESMGRVHGQLTVGDREVEVSAFAFKDHSWGARDYGTLPAYRWVWATFGEDLFLYAATAATDDGQRAWGYVCRDGQIDPLTHFEANARIADDGVMPVGCDARLRTASGRGYRLRGEVDTGSLHAHYGNFFMVDGLAEFELGGRRGIGLLETSQLRNLSAGTRRRHMVDEDIVEVNR
jgi:hypothetical protein